MVIQFFSLQVSLVRKKKRTYNAAEYLKGQKILSFRVSDRFMKIQNCDVPIIWNRHNNLISFYHWHDEATALPSIIWLIVYITCLQKSFFFFYSFFFHYYLRSESFSVFFFCIERNFVNDFWDLIYAILTVFINISTYKLLLFLL